MKIDKNKFYEQLKRFTNKHIAIFIDMPVGDKYRIILDEYRPAFKITHNYTLQIIDRTKTGYEKYVCNDIEFNLIKENIRSDYQLYKYVNRRFEEAVANEI